MQSEIQLRRRARAEGLTLVKYRESSRWYNQYGPYALRDGNRLLVAYGLGQDDVEEALAL